MFDSYPKTTSQNPQPSGNATYQKASPFTSHPSKRPVLHAYEPLPNGRGSDAKSRGVNEAIGATTDREWLPLHAGRKRCGRLFRRSQRRLQPRQADCQSAAGWQPAPQSVATFGPLSGAPLPR